MMYCSSVFCLVKTLSNDPVMNKCIWGWTCSSRVSHTYYVSLPAGSHWEWIWCQHNTQALKYLNIRSLPHLLYTACAHFFSASLFVYVCMYEQVCVSPKVLILYVLVFFLVWFAEGLWIFMIKLVCFFVLLDAISWSWSYNSLYHSPAFATCISTNTVHCSNRVNTMPSISKRGIGLGYCSLCCYITSPRFFRAVVPNICINFSNEKIF